MLKKMLSIGFLFFFLFSITLLSGCTTKPDKNWADLRNNCCQECINYIHRFDGEENCLNNPQISEVCREFFEKNLNENSVENCLNIIFPNDQNHKNYNNTGVEPSFSFNELKNRFNEIKNMYDGKKWSGTVNIKTKSSLGPDVLVKDTVLLIDEMWFDFDASSEENHLYFGPNLPLISIDGKASIKSSKWVSYSGTANVVVAPINFNLDGTISYFGDTLSFGVDRNDTREIKVFWELPPPPIITIEGDPTDLNGLLSALVSIPFTYENGNIILSEDIGSEKDYIKVTGKLSSIK